MDLKKLNDLISENYVMYQKHKNAELYIYNYTNACQYAGNWNEITTMCRGLILDNQGNIVARPFNKFFNIEEHKTIPTLPFEVFEKMDGSLGILYWLNDKPYIATRGSFESEQALKATDILYTNYSHIFDKLKKDRTYLFEIIYPKNKIVLDYDFEDIILLAVIDNQTGLDLPLEDIGFQIVKKYDFNDLTTLKSLNWDNKEGFVVKFSNSFRVKVKFAEYLRLHNILTNTSTLTIWENLKDNKSLDSIILAVPDEFFDWVKKTVKELNDEYSLIENECKSNFKMFDTRKECAEYYKTKKYSSILFAMMDGKDYSKIIWKIIRPEFSKPFKNNIFSNVETT